MVTISRSTDTITTKSNKNCARSIVAACSYQRDNIVLRTDIKVISNNRQTVFNFQCRIGYRLQISVFVRWKINDKDFTTVYTF